MSLITLINEKLTFTQRFYNLRESLELQFSEFSLEERESIKALLNKIEHMVFYIGCTNSVEPMLRSICGRKIKR